MASVKHDKFETSSLKEMSFNFKDKQQRLSPENDWNVDVSSEDLQMSTKANKSPERKPAKKMKLDLFMSCRNIVIKSPSLINQIVKNSSSQSS